MKSSTLMPCIINVNNMIKYVHSTYTATILAFLVHIHMIISKFLSVKFCHDSIAIFNKYVGETFSPNLFSGLPSSVNGRDAMT